MPTKNDRSAYQQNYYRNNREEVLRQRAQRYQSDPDFRATVAQRKEEERLRRASARKKQATGDIVTHTMEIALMDGRRVAVEMLTFQSAAKVIGISRVTLAKWVADMVLPKPLYRNARGKELFTQDQVVIIAKIYNRFFDKGVRWRIQPSFVKALWEELALLNNGVDMI